MQNAACASRGALIYYMRKARLRYLLACFQRTPLSTRQLVEPSTSATHPLDGKDQEQPPKFRVDEAPISSKFLIDHLLPPRKEGLVVGIGRIVLVPLDGAGPQLGSSLNIPLNDPGTWDARDRLEMTVLYKKAFWKVVSIASCQFFQAMGE